MPRWDQGELLPENRGALQAHQREAPFALEGDVYAAPTHVNDRHTYSQIALGGPDQITRADILMAQQAARLRNPHAGRSQLSSLQLTDEPPAPKPLPLPPRARAARSSIEITDQLPANAARRPPEGFFYNEHGNLQAKPAYGPRPTQISNALFGGPADSVPYADEQKHTGRAQIPDARAQRQHVDALVFGAQRAGPAHDIDLAPPHEGRRRRATCRHGNRSCTGRRASHAGEAGGAFATTFAAEDAARVGRNFRAFIRGESLVHQGCADTAAFAVAGQVQKAAAGAGAIKTQTRADGRAADGAVRAAGRRTHVGAFE